MDRDCIGFTEYRNSCAERMRRGCSVGGVTFGEGTSESPREEVGKGKLGCSHIPVKAKACSIGALSIMNSHILIVRMDVLDEADSFIRDDVWGTSGSHMWE